MLPPLDERRDRKVNIGRESMSEPLTPHKKIKFGLTSKEENLYKKALLLSLKASKAERDFFNSIQDRFEKAGYDSNFIIASLAEGDIYVFSESGDLKGSECERDEWKRIERTIKNESR